MEEEKDILKETIDLRKKLPKEINNNIKKDILTNCIFAIAMIVITFSVNFLFYKFKLSEFEIISKVIRIIFGNSISNYI